MEAKKEHEQNQIQQLNSSAEHTRSGKVFVPRADIYETQAELVILADMPGVKEDGVDITLEQNILAIYGKVEQPEFEGYRLAYSEFGVGDYKRVFTLSNEIDRDGIQATIKNGVLKLVLPKSKRAMPKKISVTAE
ncbi:MAG TPA: Hsp20/alpha crystallin family protein [Candidatus Melainabacteria bacterium]|nr:Hsp20/alpha crystallin family protein [Candidatus Melainabacteria bacterium]HIN64808.1 Hsp20/alpha crystallin family protein [Candidatus Obscuribacterales bacterium]